MRAELKSLFSFECREGLEQYEPEDPECFCIRVMVFIGTSDDDTSDAFEALVCTPSWLGEHLADPRLRQLQPRAWTWQPRDLEFGNQFLFMRRWDYPMLHDTLTHFCAAFEAPDWGSLASRIGRYLPWEFDYRYDRHVDATASAHPFPRPKPTGEEQRS